MYRVTISKTIFSRYGIYRYLILDGFYIRLNKIAIAIWKD